MGMPVANESIEIEVSQDTGLTSSVSIFGWRLTCMSFQKDEKNAIVKLVFGKLTSNRKKGNNSRGRF